MRNYSVGHLIYLCALNFGLMSRFCVLVAIILCVLYGDLSAQGYNIGIRAGISQTQFLGPSEPNAQEDYGLNGGFHFGLNFQWNFNDVIGVRSEILYNQTGTNYKFFSDDGFYIFGLFNNSRFVLRDTSEINLQQSNAYLHFPQTFHFKINPRWEAFVGGYFGVLLNPTARGTIVFGGQSFTQEHSFEQGLDFDYNSDEAGDASFFARPILIRVTGEDVDLPGVIGAYYLQETKTSDKFFGIDYGLVGGISYYMNRNLYFMLRAEYGIKDITNRLGDMSYQEVVDNGIVRFNDDNDRNFGLHLSIGFKF